MIFVRNPNKAQKIAHQAVAAGPIEISASAFNRFTLMAASKLARTRAKLTLLKYLSIRFLGAQFTIVK